MDSESIYHEKQVAALCGVHALNTLLQGPFFTEVELAQIGLELDQMEREFMRESGMEGEDYQRYLAEGSGNVANDGMFSLQVLSKALDVWGLHVLSLDSPDATAYKADPTSSPGLICNLQEHWFAIRKVCGSWWNLNSLFPAPQHLSDFYLAAFLDSLRDQGYSIFVVTGTFPPARSGSWEPSSVGSWFSPEEAKAATVDAENARKRGRANNIIESALARAGQGGTLQLRSRHAAGGSSREAQDDEGLYGDDEDQDLAAAIAASLEGNQAAGPSAAGGAAGHGAAEPRDLGLLHGAQRSAGGGAGHGGHGGHNRDHDLGGFGLGEDMDDDPELAAAIAASLADAPGGGGSTATPSAVVAAAAPEPVAEPLDPEPEAGSGGAAELAFRLPGGARCSRRFPLCAPCSQLYAFLAHEHGLAPARTVLTTQFPRKVVPNDKGVPLEAAGIADKTLLGVEKAT